MAWFESELVAVFKRNGGLVCDGICTEAGVRGIYPAFEGGNKTIAPSSNQRYFEALWVIPMKILLSQDLRKLHTEGWISKLLAEVVIE
jgi:hypothetical protein